MDILGDFKSLLLFERFWSFHKKHIITFDLVPSSAVNSGLIEKKISRKNGLNKGVWLHKEVLLFKGVRFIHGCGFIKEVRYYRGVRFHKNYVVL